MSIAQLLAAYDTANAEQSTREDANALWDQAGARAEVRDDDRQEAMLGWPEPDVVDMVLAQNREAHVASLAESFLEDGTAAVVLENGATLVTKQLPVSNLLEQFQEYGAKQITTENCHDVAGKLLTQTVARWKSLPPQLYWLFFESDMRPASNSYLCLRHER